jgi:hypothetical protein
LNHQTEERTSGDVLKGKEEGEKRKKENRIECAQSKDKNGNIDRYGDR